MIIKTHRVKGKEIKKEIMRIVHCCISHTWISLGNLQGHDGENLHVDRWVAVANDEGFCVGTIMSLKGEEDIRVDFLNSKQEWKL